MRTMCLCLLRGILGIAVAFFLFACGDSNDKGGTTTVIVITNESGQVVEEEVPADDEEADAGDDEAEEDPGEEEEAIPETQVLYEETMSVAGAADPLFRQTPDCVSPTNGTITATMTWDDGGEIHAWLNRSDDSQADSQDVSPIVLSHSAGPGQGWWVEIRNGTNDGIQKHVTITITFTPD